MNFTNMFIHSPLLWLMVLAMSAGLFACGDEVNPVPPPFILYNQPVDLPESHLDLPLTYDVAAFEAWFNEKIHGTFIEHGMLLENGRDSIFVRVKKLAPIELSVRDGRLVMKVPLRIKSTYYLRTKNLKFRNLVPIKTDVVLTFSSRVHLEENWHIRTQTKLEDVTWIKEPTARIMGIKFNLQEPLEKLINEKKDILVARLDEKAYETINLEKAITKVWNKIQEPKRIMKGAPDLWLKFQLTEIHGEEIRLDDSGFIQVDLMVTGRTYISTQPETLPVSTEKLPLYLPKPLMRDGFDMTVLATIPYDSLSALLNNKVRHLKIGKLGNKLKVKEIQIYGSGDQLAVMADVRGIVKGKLYMVGSPEYNPLTKHIRVNHFEYDVNTDNMIVGLANNLVQTQLRDSIASHLFFDISRHIGKVPELISGAIEKGKAAKALDLNIDNIEIKSCDIRLTTNELQIIVHSRGRGSIELQKLNANKKLKIR